MFIIIIREFAIPKAQIKPEGTKNPKQINNYKSHNLLSMVGSCEITPQRPLRRAASAVVICFDILPLGWGGIEYPYIPVYATAGRKRRPEGAGPRYHT